MPQHYRVVFKQDKPEVLVMTAACVDIPKLANSGTACNKAMSARSSAKPTQETEWIFGNKLSGRPHYCGDRASWTTASHFKASCLQELQWL